MIEDFKDIPGWETIYKISNLGNIIALDRLINGRFVKGRILKPGKANKTIKINLCTGTKSISKTYTIGHLVLLTFIGQPPIGTVARHRDGDFKNNNIDNLYWGIYERSKYA